MARETVLFKSEEKKASSDIANNLRQIADKIDDGSMILKQGSEEITLEFPKNMVLELKIEEEQDRQAGFIAEIAAALQGALTEAGRHGRPRVLFSAHGLPEKVVASGDPYQWQVEESAAAIVEALGLGGAAVEEEL